MQPLPVDAFGFGHHREQHKLWGAIVEYPIRHRMVTNGQDWKKSQLFSNVISEGS